MHMKRVAFATVPQSEGGPNSKQSRCWFIERSELGTTQLISTNERSVSAASSTTVDAGALDAAGPFPNADYRGRPAHRTVHARRFADRRLPQ